MKAAGKTLCRYGFAGRDADGRAFLTLARSESEAAKIRNDLTAKRVCAYFTVDYLAIVEHVLRGIRLLNEKAGA
jgi:hypothetical protein